MAWARDVCVASRRSCKELYILTDLQRSGLDRTESEPFPKDVAAHLIDVGQAYPENAAVTRIAPHKTRVRPGESLTISATVFNAGPFPLKGAPVVLRLAVEQIDRSFAARSTWTGRLLRQSSWRWPV